MTVDLATLNQQWSATNHPHAAPGDDDKFVPHCPLCDYTGTVQAPLFAAMNDALVHKNNCEHWRGQ